MITRWSRLYTMINMVQTKKLATCPPPLPNTRSRETLFPARRQAARAQRRLSSGFSQRSDHSKSISNRLQLWHYYHQWMENTHSVRAAVDGDPRLSSLTHSDRDVALWVGEPHVDHWNISVRGGLWKAHFGVSKIMQMPSIHYPCVTSFSAITLSLAHAYSTAHD